MINTPAPAPAPAVLSKPGNRACMTIYSLFEFSKPQSARKGERRLERPEFSHWIFIN